MVLGVDYNITVHLITLTLARRGFVFVVAFNVLEMSCRLITHSHDLYARMPKSSFTMINAWWVSVNYVIVIFIKYIYYLVFI